VSVSIASYALQRACAIWACLLSLSMGSFLPYSFPDYAHQARSVSRC